VVREIENGKRKPIVCREFGFVNSVNHAICKNSPIVISFEQKSRIKRLPKPERNRVDEALLNPLTPELNPSAKRCLPRYFTGEFNF
jgi:hypothetical protein